MDSSTSPRSIQALDQVTVRNLHSGQAIVDIETIVKELVEYVLFYSRHGTSKITAMVSVKATVLAWLYVTAHQRYPHSKILTSLQPLDLEVFWSMCLHDDMLTANQYIIGEALNSINDIAESMQITTKTIHDTIAKEYQLDQRGYVQSEKPSAAISKSGTMVAVYHPFSSLPVRRQVAQKGSTGFAKKVQELAIKYSIAYPSVRFALVQVSDSVSHKKEPAWIKPMTSCLQEAIAYIFGTRLASMLEYCIRGDDTVTLECLFPKAKSDPSIVNKGDRIYVFVNKRPINYARSELKEMVSIIRKRYQQAAALSDGAPSSSCNPFMYIDIQLNADQYDVNVEPGKTAVMLHHKENIINLVTELMDQFYGAPIDKLLDRASNQPSSSNIDPLREQSKGVESPNRPNNPDVSELDELIESPDIDESASNHASDSIQSTPSPRAEENNSNDGGDMLVDSDEDDTLRSSGNWKYSMFSQDSDNDGEEDQLLPDDEEETADEPRRVPTLSEWLESAGPPTSSMVSKEQDTPMQISSSIQHIPNEIDQHVQTPVRLRASSVESHPAQSHDQPMQPEGQQRGRSVPPFISNDMDWQLEPSYARNTIPATISSQPHHWVSSNILTSSPPLERPSTSTTARERPLGTQQPTLYDMFRSQPSHTHRSSSSNITSSRSIPTAPLPSASNSPKASHQHTQATASSNIEQVPNTSITSQPSAIVPDISNSITPTRGSPPASDMMRKRQRLINFEEQQKHDQQQLTATLNLESNVDCDKEKIQKTYHLRFAGLSGLDHRSFGDPPLFSSRPSDHDTDWHIHRLDQGFILYTRNAKHQDALGDVAYEIGIVDLARASMLYAFDCLVRNKKLIAKKGLEKSIQVTISQEDPVYSIIPELKSYEKHGVDEDGQPRLYHRVTDDRIVANGFQIQWRREQETAEIILQIICIYDFGSTLKYDVSDLRELLLVIQQQQQYQLPAYDEERQDFSMMRPKKVITYLHRVAALPQAPERQASDVEVVKHLFSNGRLVWRKEKDANCEYQVAYERIEDDQAVDDAMEKPSAPIAYIAYHMFPSD
ncbi:pms1 protein homolog 1 [Lichtheimia corymbifera JMRC:FSU:9682]|uniref:Pms1 protein homolog 1 n=1 Tax=Lichtheimia corymbifera JMRC:FSU:9682 TaxID=1263082 RepID=A0A068S928_9FUNG|nr:pms1 protein homolog 1 [Lichtheimia corymbifera JMRC:FSU:9682]